MAEAVHIHLENRRKADAADVERRVEQVLKIAAEFRRLPQVGPLLTDEDLYDQDGMPKRQRTAA